MGEREEMNYERDSASASSRAEPDKFEHDEPECNGSYKDECAFLWARAAVPQHQAGD
jgi:hypothetical protein